ncbi:MAG: hypothetical protein M3Q05_10525 [Bacteroidota bacterium]|nr:hypothetical protein [Bacteroidota bacterium]
MKRLTSTINPLPFKLGNCNLSQSEGSYVNLKYLQEIAGGDLNFITGIINLFLEQSPGNVKNLNIYAEQKDWESLKKLAHKMRSPLTLVGVDKLLELLSLLEADYNKMKTMDSISSILSLFTEIWEKAIIELQIKLDNLNRQGILE